MSEIPILVLSCLAGGVMGAFFFGGLWWTVRKGMSSTQPALWFAGSLMLRMGVTLFGFYLFARGGWQQMLACLVGFVIARLVVTWATRAPGVVHAH